MENADSLGLTKLNKLYEISTKQSYDLTGKININFYKFPSIETILINAGILHFDTIEETPLLYRFYYKKNAIYTILKSKVEGIEWR